MMKFSLITAIMLVTSLSHAFAQGPKLIHSITGKSSTVRELLKKQPSKPLLVMLWATHCKPCMIEGRFMSMVAQKFEDELHFVGVQANEGVDMNQRSASKIYEKLKDKLRSFGVPNNALLPDPYLADYSDDLWQELQKNSRFNDRSTSIPLFALFDQDRNLVKIWSQAIFEDKHLVVEFLSTIENVLHKDK